MANHTKVRLAQIWRSPLLPALKRFICPEVRAPGLFIHFLFLSPTIKCIELKDVTDGEDEAVGSLLATIACEVPSLKRLILWGGLSGQSLAYVAQLKNLQELELLGLGLTIEPQFIEQLGTLMYLKNIFLDLQGSPYGAFPTRGGFHALKHLSIIAWFSLVEGILTDVSSELASLAVTAPPGPPLQGWPHDCTSLLTMVSQRWPTSLTSITVDHIGPWDDETLPMTVISPVFRLSNLQRLRVDNFVLSVTDEEIRQFAAAWPSLKSLHLPFDHDPSVPKPSLTAIYTLANHCPGLKVLHIPLTTASIPPLSDYKPTTHYLRSLSIGSHNTQLGLQDSLLVARHLDRLFPELKTLEHLGRDLDMWDKILTMMQTFRAVRLDDLDPFHNPKLQQM
jgi:hypothetical protein